MSAAFRLAKKKYTQNDLRRIMSETKANKVSAGQQQSQNSTKKIESPLAKYTETGQLMCILCKSIVRSEAVWTVHINAKQHKENIAVAKQLKEKTDNLASKSKSNVSETTTKSILKRPGTPPATKSSTESKKPKLTDAQSELPSDFFDNKLNGSNATKASNFFETTLSKTSIRKDLVNIKIDNKKFDQKSSESSSDQTNDNKDNKMEVDDDANDLDDKLPEGFFDDPKKDAKARNQEYKDPNDEEWEKFQREIKEATVESMAIINEEQEESTAERQISEIDEQIRNWSRVLDLEKQKESVVKDVKSGKLNVKQNAKIIRNGNGDSSGDEDDDNNDDFDEFLDWRAKKSHK
uniref:Zinc finger protein 830 n=1 Tax=Corethrella appendiculata TaxID=1370023 RepID=U5EY19_9DIPT